jgi:hypothetical protein
MPNQRESTLRSNKTSELLAERRLADAWFARKHDECTITSCGGLKGFLQLA